MQPEIADKLNTVFRHVFQDPSLQVHDAMTAGEVANWDSLSHMTMIQEVEKAFGIKFKLKEITRMKDVGDMATLIQEKLA
jgi:acyl carrier protein